MELIRVYENAVDFGGGDIRSVAVFFDKQAVVDLYPYIAVDARHAQFAGKNNEMIRMLGVSGGSAELACESRIWEWKFPSF